MGVSFEGSKTTSRWDNCKSVNFGLLVQEWMPAIYLLSTCTQWRTQTGGRGQKGLKPRTLSLKFYRKKGDAREIESNN